MQMQMTSSYSYESILAASQRANWRVEDVIGGERRLDFTRPFMPESLARVEPLGFLQPRERLALNQIRGNGYLYMFGVCEEYILPFVMDQARPHLTGDDHRVRALLGFAGEEAKHIDLFKRFREEFAAGFGTRCPVLEPSADIARAILAHQPLAVALLTLHIEWMTQRHYVDSVKDAPLDPQFASLLRHHWMEEAQHAKLDTLLVEALARPFGEGQIMRAIDEYLEIGGMLDGGLRATGEAGHGEPAPGHRSGADRIRARAVHRGAASGATLDVHRIRHHPPAVSGHRRPAVTRRPYPAGADRPGVLLALSRARRRNGTPSPARPAAARTPDRTPAAAGGH